MPQEMTSAQLNEQEIQFKKRARRRLVGAIALVLLMVTVLPMVLDDRAAKSPPQEIAISIPSQDGTDFTSKVIPVAPSPTTPSTQAPLEIAPSDNTKIPAPIPPKAVEVPTAKDMPQKSSVSAKTAEPVQKPAAENKPVEADSKNTFAVQIGVFSDAANVRQMEQKLSSQGYKSYTEKLETAKGEKIRLRAGPFASRADAEKALSRMKDAGLSGMVVSNK